MRDIRVRIRLGINDTLDLGQTLAASLVPAIKGMPAEVAGTRQNALGMKPGVLVERHEMRGVRRAKDMAAVPAVVATQEEAKRRATGGRVAVGRRPVCFPVVLGGQPRDGAKMLILHPFVLGQFADTVRPFDVGGV